MHGHQVLAPAVLQMKKQVSVQSSQKTGAQSAISTILQKGVTVQYSENAKASNSTGTFKGKKQNISFFLFTRKVKYITNQQWNRISTVIAGNTEQQSTVSQGN